MAVYVYHTNHLLVTYRINSEMIVPKDKSLEKEPCM